MYTKAIISGLVFAFVSASSAQAQMTVDVSKITCAQYALGKIASPKLIAAWLSGYYNAKRNNTVIDVQNMEANIDKVQFFCQEQDHDNVLLMNAVEQLIDTGK